jgi:hypothetical protein
MRWIRVTQPARFLWQEPGISVPAFERHLLDKPNTLGNERPPNRLLLVLLEKLKMGGRQ